MKFKHTEVSVLDESKLHPIDLPENHDDAISFIKDSYKLKPEGLFISEVKWKYMMRNVFRGKNILIVGPSGFGKTISVKSVQNVFNRPKFFINLGATQDPRTSLIGSTHFNKDTGTLFKKSYFIEAITTPGAIILLDELSRAHPDAWNILMTILDPNQRYIRLDEDEDHTTINVADGVSFLATANIGNEYTATRTMDKALLERFQIIEVDILNEEQEEKLLSYLYPSVDKGILKSIAKIASQTRDELNSENSKLSTMISPRMSVETSGLIYDGFSLKEAAEVAILPHFSVDGGNSSERVLISSMIQKYIPTDEQTGNPNDVHKDDLFGAEDIANAFVPKP